MWWGDVDSNTDKVFAAIAIPRGGVFHGMNFDVHISNTEKLAINVVMYAITGYAVPILDPDAAALYDAIWDAQVPKAVAGGNAALDLDTGTASTIPEYEPGLVNWAGVFDMESGPQLLYRKRKIMTIASAGKGPAATGTMTHWLPTDRVNMSVSGGQRVKVPTAIMFAMSSPVLDETTSTALTSPTEKEWVMLQYLEDTAIDALKFLIGLVETGAESPYEEAAAFLDKTLMPDPFEQDAGMFVTGTWKVAASGSFTSSVPGTMTVNTLDGDK